MALIWSLAISLVLTIALETGFYIITNKLKQLANAHEKKDLLLVVLVNVLTNPAVVLLYWLAVSYTDWNTVIVLAPLELSAIFIEGFYYKKYGSGFRRPYMFSAAANTFSFGTGVLIQMFI